MTPLAEEQWSHAGRPVQSPNPPRRIILIIQA